METKLHTQRPTSIVRALIYTRASMDRHYLMRSTDDQETDCRTWCDQEKWEVGKVITDANRSASRWRTREREGFEEALRLIASKEYDAFVTWEPSRAGRELLAYVQLRAACQEAGVLYLTKGRVYDFSRHDDAFMMGLEFLSAEKDAAVIRDRQLRTVRLNAQKGRPHGRLPYGYRRVYDEQTRALVRQEIDPEKAAIIVAAVDEILDGGAINQIVTRLNRQGVPTPMKATSEHSRGWTTATIRQIIKSPTIAGLRMYQGEVIGQADWPAIIPIKKWEKVNHLLDDRARRTRYVPEDNPSHPRWLLTFVARCGYCMHPLVRVHGTKRRRRTGLRHDNYVCGRPGCRKVSIDLPKTDAYVTGALLGWLSKPESLAVIVGPEEDWSERVREAEEQVAALRQRLDEAANEYAEGSISMTMLTSIERRLIPEIERAAKAAVPPVADKRLLSFMQESDLEAAWEALELVEKRRLLKMLLDIRVEKATQVGPFFNPDRIKITPRFSVPETYQWKRPESS